METTEIKNLVERIKNNISKVIIGKDEVIELILTSFLCSGHVLLEDVPGVGKTMLARSLAKSVSCDFKRIQFTPDLLPSDLTGINFFDQKQGQFVFRPGPLFSNIVLGDEINRATPRTQSSLLECMEERQVTVDGETRKLSDPFFVIATQNPVETRGTYSLPEAQLDRFFLRVKMGYPSIEEGKEILDRFQSAEPIQILESVVTAAEIADAQKSFSSVVINDTVKEYIINIIEATRKNEKISLGVSPRGSIALMKGSQLRALLSGRDFVTPDDVKHMAVPVLAHRIIAKGSTISGSTANAEILIQEILKKVTVPVENI